MEFKIARTGLRTLRSNLHIYPLILLCVFSAGFQSNSRDEEKKMESSSYVVDFVDKFEIAPDGDSDILWLLKHGEYKINKKDRMYEWYAKIIKSYKSKNKLLFVEFAPMERKVLD